MRTLNSTALNKLLETLGGRIISSSESSLPDIEHLSYDSRKIQPRSAFFCLPGEKSDGNQFIDTAITSGANCIISEVPKHGLEVPLIVVPDVRLALAAFADEYYDHPSHKLRLIGVTGTNGKTTTTHLVEHILQKAGKKVGLIGTLGARISTRNSYGEAKHTTPQAPELQEMLFSMLESGCSHVSMEVSSHSLTLKRVAACQFSLACLSNISQDHLDFHKTMENYWKAKRLLFESLTQSPMANKSAVLNIDDPLYPEFKAACGSSVNCVSYGFSEQASIRPLELSYEQGKSHLRLQTPGGELSLRMRLVGRFNVYNAMAATAVCLAEGIEAKVIESAFLDFEGVPGRFECVSIGAPGEPLCIVDYAHTPDGLDNVLRTASDLKKPGGRLICVFGCGGDRDPSKRPQMGEIAESRADLLIVTSDNPRSEDPQEIIAHILAGIRRIKSVNVEPDRSRAIELSISLAKEDDIVIVAGKGHENYQLIKDQVLPFDDKIEIKKALNKRFKPESCLAEPG